MTMVQSAELPRRSPARLSRPRLALPVEIGTGAVPQSDAKLASVAIRAGGLVTDSVAGEQRRGEVVYGRPWTRTHSRGSRCAS